MQLVFLVLVVVFVEHIGAVSAAPGSSKPQSGIRHKWANFVGKLTGKSIQRTDSELKSGIAKLYDEVKLALWFEIGIPSV